MTIGHQAERRVLVLPKNVKDGEIRVFQLPHSSNNASKANVKLYVFDGQVYQIRRQTFSRGCEYNRARDAANEKYRYTSDSKPVKSGILTNEAKKQDGWLLENGTFEFSTKYDLGFSLCGVLYSKTRTQDENDYHQSSPQDTTPELEDRFLMIRDFHNMLIDSNEAWSSIPSAILQSSLEKLSDSIVEGGDTYHKLTAAKVTEWLADKVVKITNAFPQSIPLPKNLPDDILEQAKIVYACNLLISLIPKPAYQSLVKYSSSTLDIAKAFSNYKAYMESIAAKEKEQELLINAAMKVGMGNGSTKSKPMAKKPAVVKKVTKISKGAIDGFFKKKK